MYTNNIINKLDIKEVHLDKLGNTVITKNRNVQVNNENKDKILVKEDYRLKNYLKTSNSTFDKYV